MQHGRARTRRPRPPGYLVEWGDDGRPARRRPGRDPQPAARPRSARPRRASSSATCTPTTTSTSSACAISTRGASRPPDPLPVHLPPGGRARLDALAERGQRTRSGSSTRRSIAREYDPDVDADDRRPRRSASSRGRHYVPAWGVVVEAPDGARLGVHRRHRPVDARSRRRSRRRPAARRERARVRPRTTTRSAATSPPDEAIDLARRADARSALLVHYGPDRRAELDGLCAAAGPWVRPAVDGLTVTVSPAADADRRDRPGRPPRSPRSTGDAGADAGLGPYAEPDAPTRRRRARGALADPPRPPRGRRSRRGRRPASPERGRLRRGTQRQRRLGRLAQQRQARVGVARSDAMRGDLPDGAGRGSRSRRSARRACSVRRRLASSPA